MSHRLMRSYALLSLCGAMFAAEPFLEKSAGMEGNPHKKTDGGAREQTVNNPVAIVDRESIRPRQRAWPPFY